ncbi:MAG: DNA cytosine methyltransferase, partial [Alphaproteobacteria bacterium]|nr:DNA cytosine methyltransferase [Alphaproteobacteria bacterium]
KKPYLTLAEAIGDLPLIASGGVAEHYSTAAQNPYQARMRDLSPAKLADHNAPKNNPQLIRLMEALPDGGSPDDLPPELRPTSGFKNTYSRLWWNRPAPTITRNLSTPSSSRCIHPRVARPLTTREGARLQSFPDSYHFYGSRSDRNLQVGNAVPPLLSVHLAESVLSNFIKG